MLQNIRNKSKGWLAWTIIAFITLPFMLWGIDRFAYSGGDVIATVNSVDIKMQDFRAAYTSEKQKLQAQLGDEYDATVNDLDLRNKILDRLINIEVIAQWAEENNIHPNKESLRKVIMDFADFKENGKFSKQKYFDVLKENNLTPEIFERQQEQQSVIQEYIRLIEKSSISTLKEIDELANIQAQERRAKYLYFDMEKIANKLDPSEKEQLEFFKEKKDTFMNPEQLKLEYILVSSEKIKESLKISAPEIEKYYQKNISAYTSTEKRKVAHILINEEDEEKSIKLANELYENLKDDPKKFEQLAKQHSKDTLTSNQGGELHAFEKGIMPKAFEEFSFNNKVNQISKPIKTEFGYHLIKILAINKRKTKNLTEIKEQIKEDLLATKSYELFTTLAEELNVSAFENPTSLAPLQIMVDKYDIKIETTPFFSSKGTKDGITSNKAFLTAAFSKEVKDHKLNSKAIEINDTSYAFVRLKEYKPASQQKFIDIKEKIKEFLQKKQAADEIKSKADKIFADLQTNNLPLDKFKNLKLANFKETGLINRNTEDVPANILELIFNAAKPQNNKPTNLRSYLNNGDYIIIQVVEQEINTENAGLFYSQVGTIYQQLIGATELQAIAKTLLQNAKIVKNESYRTIN